MNRQLYDRDAAKDIAEQYQIQREELFTINMLNVHLMRKLICKQFSDLSKIIYFDFTDKDPYGYKSINEILNTDWRAGVVKVNTSGNDSILWGKVYNLMFRAIHDYIHCVGELGFTYQDEVKAFRKQYDWSVDNYAKQFPNLNWDLYKRVLRSEIVYQAAVKEHFNEFHIEQKIIITDLLNSKS